MIHTVAETGSTNADLAARLAAGERVAEGAWLVADRQSAGKGRQGRAWFDGSGNFMGSTVVRLHPGQPPAPTLALVAGIALYESVLPLVPAPFPLALKWPNDLLVGDAKLAGILLERVGDAVVVGIGVNLAVAPPVEGRRTTTLAAHGPVPDRDGFAVTLAAQFAAERDRWRTCGLEPILRRWRAGATPPGTRLSVHEADGRQLHGAFDGLDDDGSLRLRLDDGTTRAIYAGDVILA